MNGPFAPTHVVPEGGLAAYADPDPNAAPVARLDPRLEVEVRRTWGAWAEIVCSNGWGAWVDARYLIARGAPAAPTAAATPATATATPTTSATTVGAPAAQGGYAATYQQARTPQPAAPAPLAAAGNKMPAAALVGAAVAVVGTFVSWLRDTAFVRMTGHDVPMQFLVDPKTTARGPIKVGAVIVLAAIAGAVFAVLPGQARWQRACGWGIVAMASLYIASWQRTLGDYPEPKPGLLEIVGFGVYVCLAGGLALALAPGAKK